ncbi:biotin transporter BioY [Sphaerochaeta sp. PS]|uniref:biotin transporter BioY n=1 Tax=Sphaerochaeta sp. PS TaxID=3076336 RepID=UPI0028A37994|nr:biotin transporter BioY [Sphaerochaeta sp. PS]MDT4762361.1 biotin transporter BioY [Sphaerochaeta sp. PS]
MKTQKIVLTALFSALIIVGAYLRFPLPPVPITLQTLFVITAALLGGTSIGLASVATYLLLGAVGLPVFTTGGGLAALFGPTGGFLFGLLPAALLAGIAGNYGKKNTGTSNRTYLLLCILFGVLASLAIYLVGVPFLKYNRSLSWATAIKAGMLPFLIGDTVKLIVAINLAQIFSPRVRKFLDGSDPS